MPHFVYRRGKKEPIMIVWADSLPKAWKKFIKAFAPKDPSQYKIG